MSKSRDKTKNGLGMLYSTASNKLNRMLLFKFIQETGNDICFRCGKKIENIGEFTIEHKTSWLNSNDPLSTFFDLDNISFSHHKCNAWWKALT